MHTEVKAKCRTTDGRSFIRVLEKEREELAAFDRERERGVSLCYLHKVRESPLTRQSRKESRKPGPEDSIIKRECQVVALPKGT